MSAQTPPPAPPRAAIERVAARAGFEVQWEDAHGRKQRVSHETLAALLAALGLVSIGISWWTVHTIFTLRYAEMYYTDPVGGVDFNSDERPSYQDFMYLAMTIGMTFQVSDTDLKSTAIRATALRHALLSYLLGSLILAAAVNLVAGLG